MGKHDSSAEGAALLEATRDIVVAFLERNSLPAHDVAHLIGEVHAAVVQLAGASAVAAEPEEELRPAVAVRNSVTPDYIVCLEDGTRLKALKRHLMRNHGLTAEEYRRKWNLPFDYPMVADSFSQERSNLAKRLGLGRNGKRR